MGCCGGGLEAFTSHQWLGGVSEVGYGGGRIGRLGDICDRDVVLNDGLRVRVMMWLMVG